MPTLLGGEEGLEHPADVFRRDAGAGVGDAERDKFAGQIGQALPAIQRAVASRDAHRAALRHGIARIDAEVHQRDLQLGDVALDRTDIVREIDDQIDVAAHRLAQHLRDLVGALAQIDDVDLQRLAARERQDLPDQLDAAIGCPVDRLDCCRSCSASGFSSSNSALPWMMVSRLLKSCAMPPAVRPMASSFWVSRRALLDAGAFGGLGF